MNARIDIITPAGKSLEGFPTEFISPSNNLEDCMDYAYYVVPDFDLTPGDKIIIEVLP